MTTERVICWVRLHIGELPILWNSAGQNYNPDFIVIDDDATHWVVEVKMDKEMTSEDVKGSGKLPSAGPTTSTPTRRSA